MAKDHIAKAIEDYLTAYAKLRTARNIEATTAKDLGRLTQPESEEAVIEELDRISNDPAAHRGSHTVEVVRRHAQALSSWVKAKKADDDAKADLKACQEKLHAEWTAVVDILAK